MIKSVIKTYTWNDSPHYEYALTKFLTNEKNISTKDERGSSGDTCGSQRDNRDSRDG